MRLRFAIAAALPALASLAAMALLADRLARSALEDELGARLVVVAEAAASGLPAERVDGLRPGDEGTRTYGHIRARIETLAAATGTHLFVVRLDRTALVRSEGGWSIGAAVPSLERDRLEISEVARGRALASQVLFEGIDGKLYKTGYAPLTDADGKVVAVVGADGTAPSFATLRAFRSLVIALAIVGAVLGALVAAAAALRVTRPLRSLAAAARRIGAGDLETPLSPRDRAPGEVETLRQTLEEMRQALHARNQEREMMLAGVAHEVRNPLGGIALFAGMLADDLRGRPELAHVERIRTELGTLQRIVDQFLDYARARPFQRESVEASALAAELENLALPWAEERGVRIESSGAGVFEGDREALRRAALNLLRNAVEASPAGQLVSLFVRAEERDVAIEVTDRGPGLTAEARARLFEPFFTTKERGTGLGLALAKKVADAHGGRLSFEEREGAGTCARLVFPRQSL